MREYRQRNPDKYREHKRRFNRALRQAVLIGYGAVCASCGYNDVRALDLDHVNNDGGAERRAANGNTGGHNWKTYPVAIDEGFPPRFQLLCRNCNWIKHLSYQSEVRANANQGSLL